MLRDKIEFKKQPEWWLIYPLIAVSVLLNFYFYHRLGNFKETEGRYQVAKVLDGDSFTIDLDQTIRLANLDAPQLEFCYGKEAKGNLEGLILQKYVKIERVGRDKFGRMIGMVYLNDELVNEIIVRNGWARYASGGTTNEANEERIELMKRSAKEAKEKGLGIWNPRCHQKENKE